MKSSDSSPPRKLNTEFAGQVVLKASIADFLMPKSPKTFKPVVFSLYARGKTCFADLSGMTMAEILGEELQHKYSLRARAKLAGEFKQIGLIFR